MKKIMMFICAVSLSGSIVMAQETRLVNPKLKMDDSELKIKKDVSVKHSACLSEAGKYSEFNSLNSNGETADVEIVTPRSKCSSTPITKVTSDKVKSKSCSSVLKAKEDKIKVKNETSDSKTKATKTKDEDNGVDWKLDENSVLPLGDLVEFDSDGEKIIINGGDGSETKLKENKLKRTDADSQLKMKNDKATYKKR